MNWRKLSVSLLIAGVDSGRGTGGRAEERSASVIR